MLVDLRESGIRLRLKVLLLQEKSSGPGRTIFSDSSVSILFQRGKKSDTQQRFNSSQG